MNRREFTASLAAASAAPALLGTANVLAAPHWALSADIAECCTCAIPCPCNFGRPTKKACLGNRLIQITEGNIDGASLAGVSFLATFDMGNWVRIYVDETVDDARMKAFEAVFPLAFQGFDKLMVARERVPLTVKRTADTVSFAVPDSAVEMKLMAGLNGKPVTIANLPSPVFHDYTQFESVVHRHRSASGEFSASETNGFTSKMIVQSAA